MIIDFKMPIINGINTAISLRAYERAYKRDSLIPVLFFCDPPDSEAFRKVLSFCSPAMLFPGRHKAPILKIRPNSCSRTSAAPRSTEP